MRSPTRLTRTAAAGAVTMSVAAAVLAAVATAAGPAQAATAGLPAANYGVPGARDAVFVQTDNASGNAVVAYHRAADGALTLAGTYPTGGLGGQLVGSVVDHLASQGSLTYDPVHALLYAVNAGSNTLSVFAVAGDRLFLRQVIGSGGQFPVSVAVHDDLVYVLNALGGGSVQGFRVAFGRIIPLPGSNRALGLDPTATPQFTNTPGQVAFSPDGTQLVVTTKANGNDVDVFGVLPYGGLTAAPVVNPEPGAVPFAIAYDDAGDLVIAEAGPSALATFTLHRDGSITQLSAVGDGQAALCWVTPADGLLFASNAGSASETGYSVSGLGQLAVVGTTATDPGTVDAAASLGGQFLYVQTGGNGVVDEFAVGSAGALTEIGSVTVAGAVGGEGIAAQ
jgi:6-phosphogluconolactonase (cycloisomerase 2 family)